MYRAISAGANPAIALLCVVVVTACGSSERPVAEAAGVDAPAAASDSAFTNIDPRQAAELIQRDDHLVVNVHIPFEGEIAGTDVHIPFDQIETHLGQLPQDKNAPIVLYCRSGRMSRIAGETLASLGYTRLYHLDGGMNAWQAAGYPLQTTPPGQ